MESRTYRVQFSRQALRDLDKLRKRNRMAHDRAVVAVAELETAPLAGHALSGSLRGCRSLEFSVKGSGQYRAVYIVLDAETVCVVFVVGTHENVYDEAGRRIDQVRRDPLGS